MFTIRYRLDAEWYLLKDFTQEVQIEEGEEVSDPSYVLGVLANFSMDSLPPGASEVSIMYHWLDDDMPIAMRQKQLEMNFD